MESQLENIVGMLFKQVSVMGLEAFWACFLSSLEVMTTPTQVTTSTRWRCLSPGDFNHTHQVSLEQANAWILGTE